MIPYLVDALLSGRTPALTSGEQLWDYLYVDDAAEALRMLVATPAASGFYVLGSGEARPIRAIAELIRDRIDPALPLEFGEKPDARSLLADVSKLVSDTGWAPRTPLAEGIAEMIAWHRARLDASTSRTGP